MASSAPRNDTVRDENEDDASRGTSRSSANVNRPVRTASAVYPVVSFTEKDLAQIEAQSGVRVRCAAEAAIATSSSGLGSLESNELSPLMPVVAEKDLNYHGDVTTELEYATGKVARLSKATRFRRWLKKLLGMKLSEAQVGDYEDPETVQRLLLQQQEDERNSKCGALREAVNSGSAAVVAASMFALAILLVIYYFKNYTSFSNTLSGGSHSRSNGGPP